MALVTPQVVAADGALTWELFSTIPACAVTDQTTLYAFIATKIAVADSWMKLRLAANYNPGDADTLVVQAQGQSFITLHYLSSILRAAKTEGIHYQYISEEGSSYDALIERDWLGEAMGLLDQWITIEQIGPGRGFFMPYFGISQATPTIEDGTNGLDPLVVQLEEALARARGISNNFPGVVVR